MTAVADPAEVLFAVLERHADEDGRVWAPQAEIMSETAMSRDEIRAAVARLRDAGRLEPKAHTAPDGRAVPVLRRIPVEVELPPPPAVPRPDRAGRKPRSSTAPRS